MFRKVMRVLWLMAVLAVLTGGGPLRAQADLARTVAVVYNPAAPGSEELARHYAAARGIPEKNLIAIRCPVREQISRNEYDSLVKWPLRFELTRRGLYQFQAGQVLPQPGTNPLRYVVLMRGMPLRIGEVDLPMPPELQAMVDPVTGQKMPEGFKGNEASVDTELALLPLLEYSLAGPRPNPFYNSRFQFQDNSTMLVVTRLDGPTVEDVKRMIDDSVRTEKTGLQGRAYVDARGIRTGPMALGDEWMEKAAANLRSAGWRLTLDQKEELFPQDFPMEEAAVYLGWYAENVQGPFLRPDFRFKPGAIAYHLHSFSAQTLASPSARWCGPLIKKGAAATIGNVGEPYLLFTADLDVLTRNLLAGRNFGDSAYASLRGLSWKTTVVGDPLYTPFPKGKR